MFQVKRKFKFPPQKPLLVNPPRNCFFGSCPVMKSSLNWPSAPSQSRQCYGTLLWCTASLRGLVISAVGMWPIISSHPHQPPLPGRLFARLLRLQPVPRRTRRGWQFNIIMRRSRPLFVGATKPWKDVPVVGSLVRRLCRRLR